MAVRRWSRCVVCGALLPLRRYSSMRYCSVRCRVRAFRMRKRGIVPKYYVQELLFKP